MYPIIKKLNDEGVRIWYDEGIPLCQDWCNSINEKLMGCALFLSFISPHVNESENTIGEIKLALEKKKPFLTVFLRPTELAADVKGEVMRIQGIMKFEMAEDAFYEKLKGEIKKMVKK